MGLNKCMVTWIPHYGVIQNSFTVLNILCASPTYLSLFPTFAITDLLTVSIVLPFPECHIVEIIQYVAFSDHVYLSFSNMYLEFFLIFSWLESSFPFSTESYLLV